MKIRFPEIEYGFKIHPKPRGNWRPKVDMWFRLEVKEGELAWRPHVPSIVFANTEYFWDNPSEALKPWKEIEGNKVYKAQKKRKCGSCSVCKGVGILPEGDKRCSRPNVGTIVVPLPESNPWLYGSPRKGKDDKFARVGIYFGHYLEPGFQLQGRISFYLPWRPGPKPDYSDFAGLFSVTPKILYELLQDGLDSGVSEELTFEFKGRPVKKSLSANKKNDDNVVVFV